MIAVTGALIVLLRLPALRCGSRRFFATGVVRKTMRAGEAYKALLADAKKKTPVIIDPAADALMSSAAP